MWTGSLTAVLAAFWITRAFERQIERRIKKAEMK